MKKGTVGCGWCLLLVLGRARALSAPAPPNNNNNIPSASDGYLGSLSRPAEGMLRAGSPSQNYRVESSEDPPPNEGIPEEHYAYHYPMAGWAGYKDKRWGGYLDHLQGNE